MTKLEEITLFSKLIRSTILNIHKINDKIWMNIDRLIVENADNLNFTQTVFIIPSLYIKFFESFGNNATLILKNSITEVNKYINFVLNNIELLEQEHLDKLKMLADSFIYYYSVFIFDRINNTPNPLLEKVINFYYMRLSTSTGENLNIFQELKILNIIAVDFGFTNKEFWDLAANLIKKFFEMEFSKHYLNLIPKRLKDSSNDGLKRYEINTTSSVFYCGLTMETFLAVNYVDEEFWEIVFGKMSTLLKLSSKEPIVVLHFILLYCKKLLLDPNLSNIYSIFTDKMLSPNYKAIFDKKEVIDYLINVNFSHSEIDVAKLNLCLNKLFGNVILGAKETKSLTKFLIFYNLFEPGKLYSNENVLKVMINALLDFIKISEERLTEKIMQLKNLKAGNKKLELITSLMQERLVFLIKTAESQEDLNRIEDTVKCLIYSEIYTKLEITKLSYKAKKEDIPEGKVQFLDEIIATYHNN